jgi:hypothetical protein
MTIRITLLAVLLFVVMADCKKSENNHAANSPAVNNSLDTGMAGMRTWQKMEVVGSIDSTGARHYDTTYVSLRTQVVPVSSTIVLMYNDSGSVYPDSLMSVPSNASGIISFARTRVESNIYMSDTTITVIYDSVAYNYGSNTIYCYYLTSIKENSGLTDSTYYISHTP